jgi:hypothetical protein
MAADGQRYASPDECICEARASACVSIIPPSEADHQNPVALRYEFRGLWV